MAQRQQVPDAAAGSALQGNPEALPPLTPLARGKRLVIRSLDEHVEPLEITVPRNFKLQMEGPGEDIGPVAYLSGREALQVEIDEPDQPAYSMTMQEQFILDRDHAATFVRAEETAEGFLLISLSNANSPEHRQHVNELHSIGLGKPSDGPDLADEWQYDVVLWRSKLKVRCGAWGVERLADAERAASICLTLRAVPAKTRN
ncbi:MAG: hypothetical protein WCG85_28510 [Polyangia bacterium]